MSTPASLPQIGQGFSLVMVLEDPRQLPELMGRIAAARQRIGAALGGLDYIHSARFLPLWDVGRLLIVTEFDGLMKNYVMDFAAVLDDEFSMILSYMKGCPRLPVSRYPDEFWAYVDSNTKPADPFPPYPETFSPYADKTVIDIVGVEGRAKRIAPTRRPGPVPKVPREDVQANVLKGYRAAHALHVGIRFDSPDAGRALLAALVGPSASAEGFHVTPMAPWPKAAPAYCLNVGLTHAGLQSLGLPLCLLQLFPAAFYDGPAKREPSLAPDAPSDATQWVIGADGQAVHAMVSVYTAKAGTRGQAKAWLQALAAQHGAALVFMRDVDALDDMGTVHFGYRDGLSQPRIEGVHDAEQNDGQPQVPAGDFLLGAGYVNSRGGNFAGELPAALADNATYAAVRVMQQHEDVFWSVVSQGAKLMQRDDALGRDFVAAKLMGRWPDGSPLVRWNEQPAGPGKPVSELNRFDYTPVPSSDDSAGGRCPIGAHIRRLNPRNAVVMGVPGLRRIIRRGMPYGRPYTDAPYEDRGMFGLFFCGDLESQFEFLLGVWANQDVATSGIRGTVEPFIGARAGTTPFRFRADAASPEITIDVPPLTSTVGALYLFMPGLSGLRWLAGAGWKASAAVHVAPAPSVAATAAAVAVASTPVPDASGMADAMLDLQSPGFPADPYPHFAALRAQAPVCRVKAGHGSVWVFSHALVKEVCERKDVFLKPGKDRGRPIPPPYDASRYFGDGLFFMDPPRHTEVRTIMDSVLASAIERTELFARQRADKLLTSLAQPGQLELVKEFATPLPLQAFMNVMGAPADGQGGVDAWIGALMGAHNPGSDPGTALAGANATMALLAYLRGLGRGCPVAQTAAGSPTVIAGMAARTGCPAAPDLMSPDEATVTGLHFALGGYLSTQFLLTTGVYNLLRHPEQWKLLLNDRSLLPQAVHEMLRYDAPFQLADRWVGQACTLGGVELQEGAALAVVYGSANRDASVYADPDRFDITRPITDNNFGFGHGIHYCIGEQMALKVAQAAIGALLDHFPSAKLGAVGPWGTDPYFRTLDRLTLLV